MAALHPYIGEVPKKNFNISKIVAWIFPCFFQLNAELHPGFGYDRLFSKHFLILGVSIVVPLALRRPIQECLANIYKYIYIYIYI